MTLSYVPLGEISKDSNQPVPSNPRLEDTRHDFLESPTLLHAPYDACPPLKATSPISRPAPRGHTLVPADRDVICGAK